MKFRIAMWVCWLTWRFPLTLLYMTLLGARRLQLVVAFRRIHFVICHGLCVHTLDESVLHSTTTGSRTLQCCEKCLRVLCTNVYIWYNIIIHPWFSISVLFIVTPLCWSWLTGLNRLIMQWLISDRLNVIPVQLYKVKLFDLPSQCNLWKPGGALLELKSLFYLFFPCVCFQICSDLPHIPLQQSNIKNTKQIKYKQRKNRQQDNRWHLQFEE